MSELASHIPHVRAAPRIGVVELVVRRPAPGEREVLEAAQLDGEAGLVGDSWATRGSRSTPDGASDVRAQLTVMGARALAAVCPDRSRWPLAGDQLIVDLDLSEAHLPAGTRLQVGDAVVEVSALPHTGCRKFVDRFGLDAMRWVNSEVGRALRLRGLNARVVVAGRVGVGDEVRTL